jgi:hypothetical protein
MRLRLIGLWGLVLVAAPARAVDYAKIDRSLAKEPAYQNAPAEELLRLFRRLPPDRPKYALLLFGQEAKLRVWAVLHGDGLYLDRNGDGDLTGPGKHFAKVADCKNVEIADPDGKTRYLITGISMFQEGNPPQPHLMVNVDIKGPLTYRQYCDLEPRDKPQKAAIAHFNGPLVAGPVTINWKVPPSLGLATGDKPTDLRAVVGTMSAAHGCWVVVYSHNGDQSAFPKGVCPEVKVEFAPKTAGSLPVKKRYQLDQFC